MTFDYTKLAAVAETQLEKFGQAVTLSRPSGVEATYDPATGTSTPASPATYSGRGAIFGYRRRDIDGTLVQVGDQRLLLSPHQTDGTAMPEPQTTDRVVIGSTTYTVQNVSKTAPGGTVVMYTLQLRGA